jgi:hypothetical protein
MRYQKVTDNHLEEIEEALTETFDLYDVKVILKACANYQGRIQELQTAIGVYFMLGIYGWRPVYMMIDRKSMIKYQRILGFEPDQVDWRTLFPETTQVSDWSEAWRASKGHPNFWKVVKGEVKGIRSPYLSPPLIDQEAEGRQMPAGHD